MLHKVKIKSDLENGTTITVGKTELQGVRRIDFSMEPGQMPVLQLELLPEQLDLEIDGAKAEFTLPSEPDRIYFSATKAEVIRAVLEKKEEA